MAKYNRKKFFDSVKRTIFKKLTQKQVDGLEVILSLWEKKFPDADKRFIAYALATVFHETAATMQPIAEYGKGKGRRYGRPDGPYKKIYYGRGYVQLTWLFNYELADKKLKQYEILTADEDLVKNPDLAMRPDVAGAILVYGMIEGWFTKKKLSNYFTKTRTDFIGARAIINGTDKASLIAGYALHFLHALEQ